MPSLHDVIEFRTQLFNESMALIKQKGHDYNRQQQEEGDTLFNLQVAALLGIVPTAERGILVRLSDKFMRLISLMQPGVDPATTHESVRDTVKDIHNYVDYALLLHLQRHAQKDHHQEASGHRVHVWPSVRRDMARQGSETDRGESERGGCVCADTPRSQDGAPPAKDGLLRARNPEGGSETSQDPRGDRKPGR